MYTARHIRCTGVGASVSYQRVGLLVEIAVCFSWFETDSVFLRDVSRSPLSAFWSSFVPWAYEGLRVSVGPIVLLPEVDFAADFEYRKRVLPILRLRSSVAVRRP